MRGTNGRATSGRATSGRATSGRSWGCCLAAVGFAKETKVVLERAAGSDETRSRACRSTNTSTLDALGEVYDTREVLQAVSHLFVAVLLEAGAVLGAEVFEVDRDAVGRTVDGAHCQGRLGMNL